MKLAVENLLIFLAGNCLVFRKREEETGDFFDNIYYRKIKQYLVLMGQYPYQNNKSRVMNVMTFWMTMITFTIPEIYGFIGAIKGGDPNLIMLCVPALCMNAAGIIKYVNLEVNKEHFRKMFDGIKWEWKSLTVENEIRILQKFTEDASKFSGFYRNYVITSGLFYLLMPMLLIAIDIILHGHETRPRVCLYVLDYFIDSDTYYFPIYAHQFWVTMYYLAVVFTFDSLYMIISHHACGLFVLCGHQLKSLVGSFDDMVKDTKEAEELMYHKLRQCVITHKKALEYAEYMSETSATVYLLIIGINMLAISITAVQVVINMNEVIECTRLSVFVIGLNIHMFVISLPGQKLTNYSEGLADLLYSAEWYKIPIRMQRVIQTMLMRSRKPSKLTAGGIYDINMENYSKVLKTSMSYFTMFLSFRE